ncbi:hypothetical protein [Chitinibacter sp. GC72]|uniref:DUF6892 domain-containing protein n=1 Tax=Chitinibacter sp. GC72 TaxID=1526917 RepID=UPI0012F84458|nr:hypothetical protein [Chitinibacter sp. GC72]
MNEQLKLLILDDLYHEDEAIKAAIEHINSLNLEELVRGENPKYGWYDCIPEARALLLAIEISPAQLEKVTLLSAECCDTHFLVMPNWDGEGEEFTLTSFEGIEQLVNLKCLEFLDLSKVSDAELLLKLKLQKINECHGLSPALISQLRQQGVQFE